MFKLIDKDTWKRKPYFDHYFNQIRCLIGLMIKKHSEKSAFLIKLCRYLLAISPRRIYFPMQKLLFANISR